MVRLVQVKRYKLRLVAWLHLSIDGDEEPLSTTIAKTLTLEITKACGATFNREAKNPSTMYHNLT
jgi:hypothetical protein